MNTKKDVVDAIDSFIASDEKGMLITGTYQYKKHYLVMRYIEQYHKNARVLFRINSMQNILMEEFTPLRRQPKAGETVWIGRNCYEFDAIFSPQTWHRTSVEFDFCIVYPIDYICRTCNLDPVIDLIDFKRIKKTFYISWTDSKKNDYSMLSPYYSSHAVYDAEEEEPEYHQRVIHTIEEIDR